MIHHIDSLDHPLLDPYRKLNRTNRTRDDDWFIGEGRLVVARMLQSEYEILSVVLGDQAATSFGDQVPESADVLVLKRELVSQLVGFDFHSGVIGCARRRRIRRLVDVRPKIEVTPATVVVCPFTVLPENLGSIMRLCAGFGVDAIIVGEKSADPFSRRAIRVSMGNVFQLTVIEPDSTIETLQKLRNEFGFCLVAATGSSDAVQLPAPRPAERVALVLGNEADGIQHEIVATCDMEVAIPMAGKTDSLNVASATAVFLYQFTLVKNVNSWES